MSLDLPGKELKENCPCSKNCNWNFLYNSKFHSYNLPIYQCQSCGLQAQYPIPKLNPQEVYNQGYYSGKSEYSYKDERKHEKYDSYVWDARLNNIKKFVNGGRFLDVGCSFGGFLERAKNLGFEPYGVEVSEYSSQYCKYRGINVFNGSFLELDYPENYFNVITMIEVIEHLENPPAVFEKIGKLLNQGGLAVIQTANFNGKQAKDEGANYHYYLPGHLYYYSETNLQEALKRVGFTEFKVYYGVDFPLYAKLLKSRGYFTSWKDYWKWFRISTYHFKSKYIPNSTSSMVLYAFKGSKT